MLENGRSSDHGRSRPALESSMRDLIIASVAALALGTGAARGGVNDDPIPQNPERQEQRRQQALAASHRTLDEVYDQVGK
jgi:hypothetical protein